MVAGGADQTVELAAVDSWHLGHKDVKFMYAVDSGDAIAVATTIAKHNLKGKVGGSGWDVGVPVLQEVQKGALSFSIDQQAYVQGFVPILQLFLYNVSGGLVQPADTDTGLGFVTEQNVGPYQVVPSARRLDRGAQVAMCDGAWSTFCAAELPSNRVGVASA